jgi:hypothetical protein
MFVMLRMAYMFVMMHELLYCIDEAIKQRSRTMRIDIIFCCEFVLCMCARNKGFELKAKEVDSCRSSLQPYCRCQAMKGRETRTYRQDTTTFLDRHERMHNICQLERLSCCTAVAFFRLQSRLLLNSEDAAW